METYKFYIDKKVATWIREVHYLEAESKEDAIKQMTEDARQSNFDDLESFDEQYEISGISNYMSIEDNKGISTIELFIDDEDGEEFITDNLGNTQI